jgi:hypothetical protein
MGTKEIGAFISGLREDEKGLYVSTEGFRMKQNTKQIIRRNQSN